MPDRVVLVADDELPESHEWAYACDGCCEWIFIKESRIRPGLLDGILQVVPPPRLQACG